MAVTKKKQVYQSESESDQDNYDYEEQENSDDLVEVSQDEEDEDEDEDEDEEEEEEEEEEDNSAHLAKIKRDLAHVSFEQLAEIKGKVNFEESNEKKNARSTRLPNGKISKDQILKDLKGAASKLKKPTKMKRTKEDMKRDSKHSPMEMSSKRAVGRYREVVALPGKKRHDPRFDKLSGQFNEDLFEKSYGFLKDYKKSEQDMLKQRMKKEKDSEALDQMKGLLTQMVSRERTEQDKKRRQELMRERKKHEAELVKQGKTPYFLKKSEKRKLELMDKYQKLGEKNVDRILEKRRKRNSTKDRKHLPFNRRSAE